MGEKIKTSRHLRWESFAARIHEGPPSLEPIKGSPRATLFIEPRGARIGIRFHTKNVDVPASPLAEVTIGAVVLRTDPVIEVSTANQNLFRDFYAFCCAVADRVQLDHTPVAKALTQTLRSWSELIRQKSLLSVERQIGLMGELMFLTRVAKKIGWMKAVHSWQGPLSQEHDFTLEKVDVEVKTTLAERRIHQIDSLTQLMPKVNRPLFLVSVQLTPGAGSYSVSISEMVATVITKASAAAPRCADPIREQLSLVGWADSEASSYKTRYYPRSEMAAIAVDGACPAIVPETLSALGSSLSARIERISYAIDVDGLGVLDHTKDFDKLVFPK